MPIIATSTTRAERGLATMPPRFGLSMKLTALALLGLVLGIHLYTNLRGVDFGHHWDENYCLAGLERAVKDGTLLPGGYYYSGLYFNLGFLTLAPDLLRELRPILDDISAHPSRPYTPTQYRSVAAAQERLTQRIWSRAFILRLRGVYIVACSLGILWMFLLVLAESHSWWTALLAAALLGLSWEVAYHSRFIAVDGLLMQLSVLVLLCLARALQATTERDFVVMLRAAAVAAGLTISAKVTGVFAIIPVLGVIATQRRPYATLAWKVPRMFEACCIMAGVFLAMTPGAVLDPLRFYDDMQWIRMDYNTHFASYPYYNSGLKTGLPIIAEYLSLVVFSPYWRIALLFSVFGLVGLAARLRNHRRETLIQIAFVLPYTVFIASNKLMIARNLLLLAPLVAVFIAHGVAFVQQRVCRGMAPRIALAAVIAACLCANAAWLWSTAEGIQNGGPARWVQQLDELIRTEPTSRFFVSDRVLKAMDTYLPGSSSQPNVVHRMEDKPTHVVLNQLEIEWKANRRNFVQHCFGSFEVNYDYYPTWEGKNKDLRIVVIPIEKLLSMGLTIDRLKK